jgi:catechol 2,3-dioxygenase-like lactoylglutathione lyase family enzyme
MLEERWEVAPVLGVPDVRRALDFFCDALGFTPPEVIYGPPEAPVYAIVRRGSIAVHLQIRRGGAFPAREEHEGDAYFIVPDADALFAEFTSNSVKIHRGIQNEAYGLRDFTIETPDGHRLSFATPFS